MFSLLNPGTQKKTEDKPIRIPPVLYRLFFNFYKFRAQRKGFNNGYSPDPQVTSLLAEKSTKISVDLDKPLWENRFVVFDTETTGFYPYNGDEIIAIGAVVIENGTIQPQQAFEELVNPYRSIPPSVTQLTGICDDMVKDKRGICSVLNDFLDFIGNSVLVAHNAGFDTAFINIKLNWYSKTEISNPVLDTYKIAQALYPELPSFDLDSLLKTFSIPAAGRHSAFADSMMTAQLFLRFLEELKQRKIETVKQLYYYLHLKESLSCFP